MKSKTPKCVDDYIEGYPKEIQQLLKKLRSTVKKAAPKAEERISYGMPGYFSGGMLVYFAAFKRHIGFYPGALAMKTFKKEFSDYKQAVGSVQFPFDEPLPLALVSKVVKFRLKQNLLKKKK